MSLSEADTRAKLIDPALHDRGWTEDLIRREVTAAPDVIDEGRARRATSNRFVWADLASCPASKILPRSSAIARDQDRIVRRSGIASSGRKRQGVQLRCPTLPWQSRMDSVSCCSSRSDQAGR